MCKNVRVFGKQGTPGKSPSHLSGGERINVVVGVYGFSLITSVDSRVVRSLSLCTIDPGSAPSTGDLTFNSSGHMPHPTRRCQSRSVNCSISNPLLVEPAGTAPASCTLFGSFHTTINFPLLPGRVRPAGGLAASHCLNLVRTSGSGPGKFTPAQFTTTY